jgi:O-antigen ligase
MLLLLGVWVISLLVADFKNPAQAKIIDMIKNIVIVISIIYTLQTPKYWKQAVWITILVTTLLAALGVYQVISGNFFQEFGGLAATWKQEVVDGVFQFRLSGPIHAPNFWAQFLVAVIPLAIYRVLDEKYILVKLFSAASALVIAYAALATYSRGGFLALIAVLFLITLERRARPSLILLVVAAAILIFALLPANFTERVQSLLTLAPGTSESSLYQESSFRGRLAEVRAGLRMFAEHPILGVGAGNYPYNYQDYARKLNIETRTERREAHSIYIETLAETGLVGMSVFMLLFGSLLWKLIRVRKQMEHKGLYKSWITWIASIQMSITAYLISSIFLHGDYIRYLWILVALGTAGLYLSRKILEDPKLFTPEEVGII